VNEQGPSDEELLKFVIQTKIKKQSVEEQDIENRKRNIVVYQVPVPEKKSANVSHHRTSDLLFVQDMHDAVFDMKVDGHDITKMYRLGQWTACGISRFWAERKYNGQLAEV